MGLGGVGFNRHALILAADLAQHQAIALPSNSRLTTTDILQSGYIPEAEGHQVEFQPYEFNNTQNQLIRELSQKMRFVGYFLIALGALLILAGIVSFRAGGLSTIIQGIVQLIIGIWTAKAASSFQLIVKTQGGDIENLINALGELRKLYTLQYWLFIIALVLVVVAIVAALIFRPTVG